jgi:hypothetical protein
MKNWVEHAWWITLYIGITKNLLVSIIFYIFNHAAMVIYWGLVYIISSRYYNTTYLLHYSIVNTFTFNLCMHTRASGLVKRAGYREWSICIMYMHSVALRIVSRPERILGYIIQAWCDVYKHWPLCKWLLSSVRSLNAW